jgi:primosomal protein N'
LHFDFDITYSGFKKRVQCIFCGAADDVNCVCQSCLKKTDGLEITGQFRVIGADEKIISE